MPILGTNVGTLLHIVTLHTFSSLHFIECLINGWFSGEGVNKYSLDMVLDWKSHVVQCDNNRLKGSSTMFVVHQFLPPYLLKIIIWWDVKAIITCYWKHIGQKEVGTIN